MKKKKNDDDGLESKRLPAVLIEINSRVTSQSSTTSSLEPLVESFEVLTPFSPLNSTHPTPSISLLPSFESSSSSSSSHSDSKLNSPLTITSTSSRQRSKSDTLLEPASHHQQQQHPSESISTYSHFHLLSSLPSTNLNSPHHLTSPLVADIKVAKSRFVSLSILDPLVLSLIWFEVIKTLDHQDPLFLSKRVFKLSKLFTRFVKSFYQI